MSNEAVKSYRAVELKAPGNIERTSVKKPVMTGGLSRESWKTSGRWARGLLVGLLVGIPIMGIAICFVWPATLELMTASWTVWTQKLINAVGTQSVDIGFSYRAATTVSLNEMPEKARLFAEVHNFAVTSDPNTILTWDTLYKHCKENHPNLMVGVTQANFIQEVWDSLEEFIAYGLRNKLLHFSEVTFCFALYTFIDKLPLYIIAQNHFWLAMYAINLSQVSGTIVIADTYEFLKNISSHPCVSSAEFWVFVQLQLIAYFQYLVTVGDVGEIYQLLKLLIAVDWPPTLILGKYFVYVLVVCAVMVGLLLFFIFYKSWKLLRKYLLSYWNC